MLLGYQRVSKADGSQSLALQTDALLAAGVLPQHLYEDHASGTRDDRPGLDACLKALRASDILVVWQLDRLGRDLKHLITIVDDLTTREVGLKVLTGQGAQLDATSASGRMMLGIFAVFAEYERALLIERTKAGLAAARARGRVGGRKPKLSAAAREVVRVAMANPQTSVTGLAQSLKVHRATIYRALQQQAPRDQGSQAAD